MEIPQRVPSKRLRVFSTVIATLTYCVRNAGHLVVLAWFPCLLDSACRIALDWLIFGWPPRMPQWLQFDYFDPPTWLTPVVTALLAAMVWAFVLSDICDRNPDRGILKVPNIRSGWIRFELSPAVLLGAAVLAAINLLDGLLQFAHFKLLVAAYPLFEGQDGDFNAWARWSVALPILAMSIVAAWTYPMAAQVLRTGTWDHHRVRDLMRGNRLRLTAIFFLLSVAFHQFDVFARPVRDWAARSLVDPPLSWTLRETAIRYLIDFPFNMFWIVVWAVTIALVMDALLSPMRSAAPDRPAKREGAA